MVVWRRSRGVTADGGHAGGVTEQDAGIVAALDPPEQTLAVRTNEDEEIGYDFDGLDGLNPADAMTIHRSQVTEDPAVVIPLIISAWMTSQRDLVFAVVQRGSAAAVVDRRPWG